MADEPTKDVGERVDDPVFTVVDEDSEKDDPRDNAFAFAFLNGVQLPHGQVHS